MFMADALFGTMIAVIVTTAVLVVASQQQRGARKLAQSRSDLRALESALIQLQSGKPAPPGVTIHPIDGASAPAGWVWADASISEAGHAEILRGLIPAAGGGK
jgi:type II secretory pathway pseudopilin PulG